MEKKKNNTAYVVAQCLGYIAIGGLCYSIGKKVDAKRWSQALNYMAKYGTTMTNIVDGKEYVCSVTEVIK